MFFFGLESFFKKIEAKAETGFRSRRRRRVSAARFRARICCAMDEDVLFVSDDSDVDDAESFASTGAPSRPAPVVVSSITGRASFISPSESSRHPTANSNHHTTVATAIDLTLDDDDDGRAGKDVAGRPMPSMAAQRALGSGALTVSSISKSQASRPPPLEHASPAADDVNVRKRAKVSPGYVHTDLLTLSLNSLLSSINH